MSESTPCSTDDLSFGDALAELDRVVAALESGQLELEDSLARYERGVALVRALQQRLDDAQQKVTMLIGELETDGEDAVAARGGGDDESGSGESEIPV